MRLWIGSLLIAASLLALSAASAPVFARGGARLHVRTAAIPLLSGHAMARPFANVVVRRHARAQSRRNANDFAAFPWGWDYGSYAVIANGPSESGSVPVAAKMPTPVAELPLCRESVAGVSILRGKNCRS